MFQVYQITASGHHVKAFNPFMTWQDASLQVKELERFDREFTAKGKALGFLIADAKLSSYYITNTHSAGH